MSVITFGEAMIRLTPASHRRLEQAYALDVEIGGAELNTSVGLARLGRPAAWVSRVTNNELGRLLVNRARETGVNVERVLWTPDDRVGVYFLELGAAPRASGIVYDRANSAIAKIVPGMIDWRTLFAQTSATWFYVTGITAALSESSGQSVLESLRVAKECGLSTALDPNYRAKLWSVEAAKSWLSQGIKHVDVLITNPEDADRFFGVKEDDFSKICQRLAETYQLKAVAMTTRQTPSVWRNIFSALGYSIGKHYQAKEYEVEIVDRLGAGDAFVSGLLYGLMENDLPKGLEYGVAMGALKHSIPGDFPWITLGEVEALVRGGSLRINR